MDRLARDNIAAASALRRELGRDYDDAVAEGLIERIGAEIDKRVDARLAATGQAPAERPEGVQLSPPSRPAWPMTVLALGSMAIGITAAAAVPNAANSAGPSTVTTTVGPGQVLLVIMIWVIIGIVNVAYARRHRPFPKRQHSETHPSGHAAGLIPTGPGIEPTRQWQAGGRG